MRSSNSRSRGKKEKGCRMKIWTGWIVRTEEGPFPLSSQCGEWWKLWETNKSVPRQSAKAYIYIYIHAHG